MLNYILRTVNSLELWNLVNTSQVVLLALKVSGQLSWPWLAVLSPILTMVSLCSILIVTPSVYLLFGMLFVVLGALVRWPFRR